jgi:hypothetical protein
MKKIKCVNGDMCIDCEYLNTKKCWLTYATDKYYIEGETQFIEELMKK